MAADRRTSQGLSARIVRLTLIVGIATVVVSGAVAIVSTSRLSADRSDTRALLGVQRVEDGIDADLQASRSAIDSVTELVAATKVTDDARSGLQAALAEADELFDDAYVAESGNGLVIASMPGGARRSSVRGLPVFKEVREGRGGFFSYVATPESARELWFARTTTTASGRPVVVLALVDLTFLDDLLKRLADAVPGRVAMIMDGDSVVSSGDPARLLPPSTVRWHAETPSSGKVTAQPSEGTPLEGRYDDIQSVEGVTWRIIVLESANAIFRDTLGAVTPYIVVLTFGGLVAVVSAWGISQRLVRPLRELERTARQAAAGPTFALCLSITTTR